jgi:enoyl-CoA hydratase/carnithine racemase
MNLSKINEIEWRKFSPTHWQVTFNRPEKYNAITLPMYQELIDILDEGKRDEQLVVISFTGKGKFYSAGADLTGPLQMLVSTVIFFVHRISFD